MKEFITYTCIQNYTDGFNKTILLYEKLIKRIHKVGKMSI